MNQLDQIEIHIAKIYHKLKMKSQKQSEDIKLWIIKLIS